MIEYTNSLQRAIEIKTILDSLICELDIQKYRESKVSLWFESFDNCREQGLVLKVSTIKLDTLNIAITVHRNGDSTRVFEYTKVAFPSNLPSDSGWDNSKCFDYNKHYECAEYIKSRIESHIQKEIEATKQTDK